MEWFNAQKNITEINNLDLKVTSDSNEYESRGNTSQELIEIDSPAAGQIIHYTYTREQWYAIHIHFTKNNMDKILQNPLDHPDQ